MHKFGILFVVLCALVLVSAASKGKGLKKSAKLVRFNPKLAKAHRAKLIAVPMGKHGRRSAGRFTAAAQGSGEVTFTDEVEQLIPENDAEAQLFDEEVYEDVIGQDEVFEVEPKIAEEDLEEDDVMEAPAANPAGNFFGTYFGKTNGGAIALANSFSTGKSGQAMSTSTSYGQAPAHVYAAQTPVEEEIVADEIIPAEEQLAKYRRAAKLRSKAKPRFGKLRSKAHRAAKLRVARRH